MIKKSLNDDAAFAIIPSGLDVVLYKEHSNEDSGSLRDDRIRQKHICQ